MFDVIVSIENDEILGEFIVDSYFFEPSKYDYAFYLIELVNDNKKSKLAARRYSNSMNVAFDVKGMTGTFCIRCFLRDIKGKNIRTFDSKELSIDA